MQSIIDFLRDAFLFLYQKLESVVLTIFDLLKDFLFFCIDTLLGLAISILNTFAIPLNWNPAQYVSALPPEMINVIGLCGVGEAAVIVTTSLLIRLGMQLIPFVRLGS